MLSGYHYKQNHAECLSEETYIDVHNAAGTLQLRWKFIKTLVGILMKQSVFKYFIRRACSHAHLGLLLCLWDQLD